MTTAGTAGYGCLLKRGDGGVGASVQAAKTFGSTNSQVQIKWGVGGSIGNSKSAQIVVSGLNTTLSVVVTTSTVTINSATDGAGAATSKANDIIAALYENSTFRTYWYADGSSGNGTGTVSAAGLAFLTGGTDGGETFTTIAEVKGFDGPDLSGGVVDMTSFDSPSGYREFIGTLRDGGQVTFSVNYLPQNSGHKGILSDFSAGTKRNFQVVLNDGSTTTISLSAIVTGYKITGQIDQALMANITVKVTGQPTWAP